MKKSGMPKMEGAKKMNPFGKTKQVGALKKMPDFLKRMKKKK